MWRDDPEHTWLGTDRSGDVSRSRGARQAPEPYVAHPIAPYNLGRSRERTHQGGTDRPITDMKASPAAPSLKTLTMPDC
jgi:hypothetical protein